jgi:hypothetical protein
VPASSVCKRSNPQASTARPIASRRGLIRHVLAGSSSGLGSVCAQRS